MGIGLAAGGAAVGAGGFAAVAAPAETGLPVAGAGDAPGGLAAAGEVGATGATAAGGGVTALDVDDANMDVGRGMPGARRRLSGRRDAAGLDLLESMPTMPSRPPVLA